MNEALNVRFASSSSSSLPLSSHVHFVSNSNAPTAFLFAHALHECAKNIPRDNTTTTDENEEEKKNARNAIVLCVETRGPFEKLVGPHLKKKNNNNRKAVYESIDCWSKPVDFLFDDDDDEEEEDDSKKKKKKNDEQRRSTPPRITFTVKSANSNSISSLDGLYDLIAERIDDECFHRFSGRISGEDERESGRAVPLAVERDRGRGFGHRLRSGGGGERRIRGDGGGFRRRRRVLRRRGRQRASEDARAG